ncbi:CCA tRNA nucleotidyltransferase, mitochondrial [Asimina triloba]
MKTPISSSGGGKIRRPETSASSFCPSKQAPDSENDPPPKEPPGTGTFGRREILKGRNGSEVLNLFEEACFTSISSSTKTSASRSAVLTSKSDFPDFHTTKATNGHINDESSQMMELNESKKLENDAGHTDLNIHKLEGLNLENGSPKSQAKSVQEEVTNNGTQPHESDISMNETQATQSYPRHVPVHVVDGVRKCISIPSSSMTTPVSVTNKSGTSRHTNLSTDPSVSTTTDQTANTARSSVQPQFPTFHPPFNPFCNQPDSYRSFLNISSGFSTLILSALLQNPAAQAAASLAASFWPPCADDSLADHFTGGFTVGPISPSPPSLAAIAATTVSAASAWWASHGLLPFCSPLHTGFAFAPTPSTTFPAIQATQTPVDNKERVDMHKNSVWEDQQLRDTEFWMTVKASCPDSKSSPLSLSDSEESGAARSQINENKDDGHEHKLKESNGFQDSDKAKTKKQLDRSSCGSNTPSSSEVEADILEKKPESKESAEAESNPSSEVLPQSFSPPHDMNSKAGPKNDVGDNTQKECKEGSEDVLELDLGSKTWEVHSGHSLRIQQEEIFRSNSTSNENYSKGTETNNYNNNISEKVLLLDSFVGQGKQKARRTGFKPYKRCSVEAKEIRVMNGSQGDEKVAKRIRVGGEASV